MDLIKLMKILVVISLSLLTIVSSQPSVAQEIKNSYPAQINESSTLNECQLQKVRDENPMTPGFPRSTYLVPTTGTLKNLFIFIDFQDYQSTNFSTNQMIQFTNNIDKFFAAQSYKLLNVKSESVPELIRIQNSWKSYGIIRDGVGNFNKLIQDAITASDPIVDFSSVDIVTVVTPKRFNGISNKHGGAIFFEYQNSEKTIRSGVVLGQYPPGENMGADWAWRVNAHELGHILGLTHPYLGSNSNPGPIWDLMGNGGTSVKDFIGWHRFLLNWFSETSLICIAQKKSKIHEIQLVPINSTANGKKFVVVKIDSTTAIGVEFRRASTFDKLSKSEEGVLAYLIDVKKGDDEGIISLLGGKRTFKEGQPLGSLKSGSKFMYRGASIEILSINTVNAKVRIKY